jgi:NNP family nitrate/nitrite transporter-like MFS transporter
MHLKDFRRVGHLPTLFCAFLYFDTSFMVWVLLGALANSIVPEFGLSDAERGLMVAIPLLGGSLLRLCLGHLTDRIGARRTAMVGMVLTLMPLTLGWLWADTFPKLLIVGLVLGVAGASFAVALPLASRWYPKEYQGLAMGIAGAGNSGTALATFFAPRLAEAVGWHAVLGFALIPMLATLVVFSLLAKDSPTQPPPQHLGDYVGVLKQRDCWWFCFFYSITFGGFVGLASFLNIYFFSQYGLSRVEAGSIATLCVIAGSFLRPIGGYLSDRFGGLRMLTGLFAGVAAALLAMALTPPFVAGATFLVLVMALLGMGNGAVFQLVPQRFPREIGVITGVVGAAGGLGGFFLPTILGSVKQITGSFSGGFLLFGGIALGGVVGLLYVSKSWQGAFLGEGGRAAVNPVAVAAPTTPTPTEVVPAIADGMVPQEA